MQFINDGPFPATVMTDPQVVVHPGEVLELDDHVAGLTPVELEPDDVAPVDADQVADVELPAVDTSSRDDVVAADDQAGAGTAPADTDQGVTP